MYGFTPVMYPNTFGLIDGGPRSLKCDVTQQRTPYESIWSFPVKALDAQIAEDRKQDFGLFQKIGGVFLVVAAYPAAYPTQALWRKSGRIVQRRNSSTFLKLPLARG